MDEDRESTAVTAEVYSFFQTRSLVQGRFHNYYKALIDQIEIRKGVYQIELIPSTSAGQLYMSTEQVEFGTVTSSTHSDQRRVKPGNATAPVVI